MKLPRAHMTLFMISLLVAIGAAALYGYMYHAVGASAARAVLARSIVSAHKASDIQESKIAEMYAATAADRTRLTSFFVPDAAVVSFIETLEDIGPQAGSAVLLSNVSVDDTDGLKPGSFARIMAHVEATGSWSAVMRTLMLSEVLQYQSGISAVRLDASLSGDAKNPRRTWRLSYDITADVIIQVASSRQQP